MIFLSAAQTSAAFDWDAAITCVRDVYGVEPEGTPAPGRLDVTGPGRSMRCMPAQTPQGRFMGAKHLLKGHNGDIRYAIVLFEQESGALAYVLDGLHVTSLRTAGTSAAAVDLLVDARRPAVRVGVLGSGTEARAHVEALSRVVDIAALSVYSPSPVNRAAFGAHCSEMLGLEAHVADSAREAVSDKGLVVAAARSHDETPILYADWLADPCTVVSIGSTLPNQRELDVSVIGAATLIVSDEPDELVEQTGDLRAACQAGLAVEPKLHSLADLARGRVRPSAGASGLVLYKSIGSGLQDVAIAEMVVAACEREGVGMVCDAELEAR
jgi:ornithine cyclodeaminase/alanine dehydrogenase-like protein (mu-crystallin family)